MTTNRTRCDSNRYRPTRDQLALLVAFATIGRSETDDDTDDDTRGSRSKKPARPLRSPVERICERAGVAVERFVQWLGDDDFREWWTDATESVLRNRLSLVLRALTERAELGDLAAIKLWLPRFNRLDGGAQPDELAAYRRVLDQLLAHAPRPGDDDTPDDFDDFDDDDPDGGDDEWDDPYDEFADDDDDDDVDDAFDDDAPNPAAEFERLFVAPPRGRRRAR